MRYYLSNSAAIKRLEAPSVYHISADELYELDDEGVSAMLAAAEPDGAEFPDGEFMRYCVGEGILTPAGPRGSHPPVIQSPLPSLRYLELQVTDRCNLRCGHCYLGSGGRTDLAPQRIRRMLGEFERMQGLRVMLTGGEPLMHPHFDEINRMLPEFGLRFVLFTNGTLCDRKRLSLLNAHEIQVSVDGMGKAHDALRGAGSYDKAMRTVREALEMGMQVSVSTMVHRGNLGGLRRDELALRISRRKGLDRGRAGYRRRARRAPRVQSEPRGGRAVFRIRLRRGAPRRGR